MKILIVSIAFILLVPLFPKAQSSDGFILPAMIEGNDTFPVMTLSDIVIVSKRSFANPSEQARFERLKKNIFVVYPYAKEAGKIFNEVNIALSEKDRRKDQKKFLKQKEKELDEQFENKLKNLTTTQGEILVKLIARETGQNCYQLIRELKNPFSAFFWQNAGKLYGYNLKITYNAQQDHDIELIVRSIENDL